MQTTVLVLLAFHLVFGDGLRFGQPLSNVLQKKVVDGALTITSTSDKVSFDLNNNRTKSHNSTLELSIKTSGEPKDIEHCQKPDEKDYCIQITSDSKVQVTEVVNAKEESHYRITWINSPSTDELCINFGAAKWFAGLELYTV